MTRALRLLAALDLVLVSALLAACGLIDSTIGSEPCWPDDPAFVYEAMTVQGTLRADLGGPFFIILPNGREAEVHFGAEFTERFALDAPTGEALSPHFGLVVAQTGEQVTLWGALVPAETSQQPPAAHGRDGFVACEINGVRHTAPPR